MIEPIAPRLSIINTETGADEECDETLTGKAARMTTNAGRNASAVMAIAGSTLIVLGISLLMASGAVIVMFYCAEIRHDVILPEWTLSLVQDTW